MKKLNGLILVVLLGLTLSSCKKDPQSTGYQFPFDDMAQPVPYEAFSENPNTPDGKTMMHAPKGSVARGYMPYTFGKFEGALAGQKLKNPLATNEKTLARGEYLYNNYCQVCHGPDESLTSPVVKKTLNPPLLNIDRLKDYPAGRFYHVMTVGSFIMPEHATQLNSEDRWHIALYIKEVLHK